jgi:Holliday junction resolvase-like predicted endonuclease
MKLATVLDITNQIEKTAFFKLLDQFCNEAEEGRSAKLVDQILSDANGNIKNIDNANIEKLFAHFEDRYAQHIMNKLELSSEHLDVLIEIMIRDGNGVMSREWFGTLYSKDLKRVRANVRNFKGLLKKAEEAVTPSSRERDYLLYRDCLRTAYENDAVLNREKHISYDERTVLNTLSRGLRLSNQEVRCIRHTIIELQSAELDEAIRALREMGVIVVQRKTNTLLIPDEFVWSIRRALGLDLPQKFLRRILKNLSDAELNRVARQHSIDWKQERKQKIQDILDEGLSVEQLLTSDMFQDTASRTDRRDRVQQLMERDLEIDLPKYGRSLEQKVETLIAYFHQLERDGSASLSVDGYSELLRDIGEQFSSINRRLKESFELQPENVLDSELLTTHGVTPRDVIYLLSRSEMKAFCSRNEISNRGNTVAQIVKKYRNVDDLLFENIELVGARDLQGLQEKGLSLKESEIGRVYEKLVIQALQKLGLNVDEKLRQKLRTSRLEIDVVVNLGNDEVIIFECKTVKSKIYDKYSAIKRQLLSYETLCKNAGLDVRHHIVLSNSFSEDFVGDCEYDDELNLSLLTSRGIRRITEAFEESKRETFPIKVLQKAGLLNEERIAKVLNK